MSAAFPIERGLYLLIEGDWGGVPYLEVPLSLCGDTSDSVIHEVSGILDHNYMDQGLDSVCVSMRSYLDDVDNDADHNLPPPKPLETRLWLRHKFIHYGGEKLLDSVRALLKISAQVPVVYGTKRPDMDRW